MRETFKKDIPLEIPSLPPIITQEQREHIDWYLKQISERPDETNDYDDKKFIMFLEDMIAGNRADQHKLTLKYEHERLFFEVSELRRQMVGLGALGSDDWGVAYGNGMATVINQVLELLTTVPKT